MKISRSGEPGLQSQPRSDTFTGEVWATPVVPGGEGVMVNSVLFLPGGRTNWHRHERGQVLYVTSGRGQIASRDGSGSAIAAGDTVFIPPGEEHWHGAAPDAYLVHLAISLGETQWLEPVSDDDYARRRDA